MKSIKFKLFTAFSLALFLILFFLSIFSIHFFTQNQENEAISKVEKNLIIVNQTLASNKRLDLLYSQLDLKEQFLFIFKDNKLVFTNESEHETKEILEELRQINFSSSNFIKVDDFVVSKNKYNEFSVYMGIEDDYIEERNEAIISSIITMNSIIFVVFIAFIYFIINKTIRPLKDILNDVKNLQKGNDLSKRLKSNNTKDEFEQLTNSFNEMLENIEKSVENIKQFSSDASHELKTPLTIIQGEIELAKSKDLKQDEFYEVLNKLDIEQKKLQDIIRNFLLLARLDKEAIKKEKCFLDTLVFECIETNLDILEKKGLELKLDIQEALEVNSSKKYLSIVINNLLSNAIKYTNEGSISIKANKNEHFTFFEISDTGIGMDKKDTSMIFERFYRVDKARSDFKDGIGIGLSIVKRVCERFNISIKVESKLEKGSKFSLRFTNFH
ncbi:sensor histidine kinase [Arcobacter roscoffensis]|uniref:histidine kinase n=1 Tax=Arcobacter roscoffensis TaxID=2961520 RepID=A0ABY5E6R5_9BACT|nr:HAMP domain-containing sensor histidine kinase [Arcobacter roscoffensis]UTJ07861.1 HAMP domain-containing histidine kinase [Arcobacter roscoffensis]